MTQHYKHMAKPSGEQYRQTSRPLETMRERLDALKDAARRRSTQDLLDTVVNIKRIGIDCKESEDIKMKRLFYDLKACEVGEKGKYLIFDYHDGDRRTIIGEAKVIDITKQSLKKNGEKKGRDLFEEYYLLEYVSNASMYKIVEALRRHSDIIDITFVHTSLKKTT